MAKFLHNRVLAILQSSAYTKRFDLIFFHQFLFVIDFDVLYIIKPNFFDGFAFAVFCQGNSFCSRLMMSDVPSGVFLSGGLDSAIIAGLAAEQMECPLKCFTIGFEDQSYDERERAAATAAHIGKFARYGFDHRVKVVNPCDFESLSFLVKQFGEPFADASMIPTYLLSRFAREEVTVALSGDGADELFGGYERYLALRYLGKFDTVPEAIRRPLFRLAAAMIPEIGNERQKWARARRFLRGAASSGAERYLGILSRTDEALKRAVCGKVFDYVHPTLETFTEEFYGKAFSANPPERASEVDLLSYLREDILKKVDVASMSASLEVRSPFLDYKVVKLSCLYPYEFKEKDGVRKRMDGERRVPFGCVGNRAGADLVFRRSGSSGSCLYRRRAI